MRFPCLILFFFLPFTLTAQPPAFSVFLIGDTGELRTTNDNFKNLSQQIQQNPNSTVIFLGDNIYPNGLIARKPNDISHTIILNQLRLFSNFKGNVFFIPGNHDWANKKNFSEGKERLGDEEQFIERFFHDSGTIANSKEQTFLPSGGAPGPVLRTLYDGKLKIIFLDTQWFMYLGYKKPTPALQDSTKKFFLRLDKMLADAKANDQHVIVVGHHPVYTNGKHSTVRKSPGLIKRWKFQDMSGKEYSYLANNLDSVFKKYPGLIYGAGHDHLLEYFRFNGNDFLVSGSGSKTTAFSKKHASNPAMPYDEVTSYLEQGFFRIDYYNDGTYKIRLYLASGQSGPLLY